MAIKRVLVILIACAGQLDLQLVHVLVHASLDMQPNT